MRADDARVRGKFVGRKKFFKKSSDPTICLGFSNLYWKPKLPQMPRAWEWSETY